jgi:hypothetical protein
MFDMVTSPGSVRINPVGRSRVAAPPLPMGIVRLPERERVRLSIDTHERAKRPLSREAPEIDQGRVVRCGLSIEIEVTRRGRGSRADRTTCPRRPADGSEE